MIPLRDKTDAQRNQLVNQMTLTKGGALLGKVGCYFERVSI